MSRAPLRIYDGGLCGTPFFVSLFCTKGMKRESIEETLQTLVRRTIWLRSHRPRRRVSSDIMSLPERPGLGMPFVPTLS